MTAHIIDGRKTANDLRHLVEQERRHLKTLRRRPGLVTISVGHEFSSTAYQARLTRIGADLEVPVQHICLPDDATQDELLRAVRAANEDAATTGVLILRPLPQHLSEVATYRQLLPVKDVEAVHPENAGLLALGTPRYIPSTAASVFYVLDSWLRDAGEDVVNFYHHARIVVVGRSNNVGKPLVSLAYARQAAVESVDEWTSHSGRLSAHTRRADVLIVAAGVPGLIRAEHVRAGAIVLDVGINPQVHEKTGAVRMVGDVDFGSVCNRVRALTPVPGGIGPVTDIWLIRNVLQAADNIADQGVRQ